MNHGSRKAVFFLFLGLFLIAAPLVVLYTAGYRLNPNRLSLVKTGVFAVSSEPKGAAIFIDGVDTKQKTNTVLKNIMPGEHVVKLEKDEYFTWEKNLEIKENETTFIQKVVMFLTGEAMLNKAGDFLTFAFSHNGEKLALALTAEGWTEIWVRQLSSGEEKLLYRLPANSFNKLTLVWAFDDASIFLKKSGATTVWLSLSNTGVSQEISNPVNIWQRDSNQFLFVENNKLIRQDANGVEQILATLPVGNYEFLSAPPGVILLQDRVREKIIVVDDRGVDQPILLNADAFTALWNPQNDQQLLYVSAFEAHLFDTSTLSDELLTRVSLPIIAAAWHPTGGDILLADQNNLFAIELDRRGRGYQTFNLATLDEIKSIAVAANGQTAYLVGATATESGLFTRALQK